MMSINSGNVFSAQNVSEYMYKSLPKGPSLELRNSYDAVALLAHACMLAAGFRIIGLGEDHKIGMPLCSMPHAANADILVEATSDAEDTQSLPREWNASTSGDYAFRYAHTQSSLQYLIKISRLGSKSVVNGLGIGDDKVHTMDIKVADYLLGSAFPFKISAESVSEGELSVRKVFISAGRMTDAASLLRLQIIQKLAPGLQKVRRILIHIPISIF